MNIIARILYRNNHTINNEKINSRGVKLEYWNKETNIGDALAPIIYNFMLQRNGINPLANKSKNTHLMTVGSLLGLGHFPFDSVVWGSGILSWQRIPNITKFRMIRKLDIRAVRGPLTASVLKECRYHVPMVYGDPAVLMPIIYKQTPSPIKGRISVILHHKTIEQYNNAGFHLIDPRTSDYRAFIDEICHSEKIISSSLHGIILAESYGIPAVFLQNNMDDQLFKFYDWYYSTNRKHVQIAYSIEEALNVNPMPLPELDTMREGLFASFPYDLFY